MSRLAKSYVKDLIFLTQTFEDHASLLQYFVKILKSKGHLYLLPKIIVLLGRPEHTVKVTVPFAMDAALRKELKMALCSFLRSSDIELLFVDNDICCAGMILESHSFVFDISLDSLLKAMLCI